MEQNETKRKRMKRFYVACPLPKNWTFIVKRERAFEEKKNKIVTNYWKQGKHTMFRCWLHNNNQCLEHDWQNQNRSTNILPLPHLYSCQVQFERWVNYVGGWPTKKRNKSNFCWTIKMDSKLWMILIIFKEPLEFENQHENRIYFIFLTQL